MAFLLAEDEAIKKLFTGLQVPVRNDPDGVADSLREVPVRWRYPTTEPKDTAYPFIAVTMVGVVRDPSREHRGYTDLLYIPDEEGWSADEPGEQTQVEFPVPMNIFYDISIWANFVQHGQHIFSTILRKTLRMARFAEIEIPAEWTLRRVDLMEQSPIDVAIDPFGKRRYKASLVLRVGSEVTPDQIKLLQVQEVVFDGPRVI